MSFFTGEHAAQERRCKRLAYQLADYVGVKIISRGGGWFNVGGRMVQGHVDIIKYLYPKAIRKTEMCLISYWPPTYHVWHRYAQHVVMVLKNAPQRL